MENIIDQVWDWCLLIGHFLIALCVISLIFLLICKGIHIVYISIFLSPKRNIVSGLESQYRTFKNYIDIINNELQTANRYEDKVSFFKARLQLQGLELKIKASIEGYFSIDQKSDTDKKKKLDEILLEIIDYRMRMVGLSIICNNANHIDKQKTILLFTELKNELNNISEELDVLQIHRAIQNYLSKHSYADMEIGKELNEQIKKIEAEVEKIKQAKDNGQAQQ